MMHRAKITDLARQILDKKLSVDGAIELLYRGCKTPEQAERVECYGETYLMEEMDRLREQGDADDKLMPEGTPVYVLVKINSQNPPILGMYRYELQREDDHRFSYHTDTLPEPGPHIEGDRFGISADAIYVLA